MNLYDLVGNYKQVQAMAEDGELSFDAIKDTLESIETSIEVKASNIVYITKNLEAYSVGIDNEINRLKAKKQAIDNKADGLKAFMFGQLELVGLTEIKTDIATIKQKLNPHSVVIEDESLVPAKFQAIIPQSYKISKVDISKALKAGEDVPGCKLVQNKSWGIK